MNLFSIFCPYHHVNFDGFLNLHLRACLCNCNKGRQSAIRSWGIKIGHGIQSFSGHQRNGRDT